MSKRILVLAPHPDDAEFYAGGALAGMIAEGVQVTIAIATDGSKGSFEYDAPTLRKIRSEEARQAAAVLGADAPVMLGHPDLELDMLPAGILREQFIRLIRQVRPDIVFTNDPLDRSEAHPDHRAVARAATEAVHFSTLPLAHPEHRAMDLEPHFVVEKYYFGNDPQVANKIVDISGALDLKIAALAAHASQMVFLVEDIVRQAKLAGIDLMAMTGASGDPATAVRWAMETQAAEIGQKAGFRFGEAFRYERFHPLVESLLSA